MGYNFNQNFQYYDHFAVKEVPAFKLNYAALEKEIAQFNKEVNTIVKDLERINNLKFGLAIEEKSAVLAQALKACLAKVVEYKSSIKGHIELVSSNKNPFEQNRWEFKKSFYAKIGAINDLIDEYEPIKREALSFTESVFFILHNYTGKKRNSKNMLDIRKPLSSLFQPLMRSVKIG